MSTDLGDWNLSFDVPEDVQPSVPKLLACDKLAFKSCQEHGEIPKSSPLAEHLPFAAGDSFFAIATVLKKFIRHDGKQIFEVSINVPETNSFQYEPGDTVGILPENNPKDVDFILERIVGPPVDASIELTNSDPKRKYLPSVSTLRQLFSKLVSLNGIPMKQTVAKLAEYALPLDKRKMQFLASKEGAQAYTSVILEAGTSVLKLLKTFGSCRPPAEVLIQLLPRLLPRPYSIASSPLSNRDRISVMLSVLPEGKEGVCTGMLKRAFSDTPETEISVYFRKSNGFRISEETSPLIFVGPGTGVAPFKGFLDHMNLTGMRRKVLLFTGFRREAEYLFKEELDEHLKNGTLTRLVVSFSREDGLWTKYVQDSIKENGEEVRHMIIEEEAVIYECGDFKKMAGSVSDAFASVLEKSLGSATDAAAKIKEMKSNKKYLQDIWS